MAAPPEGPTGWSPWAPRPGSGDAASTPQPPRSAPPVHRQRSRPPLRRRARGSGRTQPRRQRRPRQPADQAAAAPSTLPARPPLQEPSGLPAGLGAAAADHVGTTASPVDRRDRPRTTAASAAAAGCSPPASVRLIGALVIGLVFAGYALGHRSSGSPTPASRSQRARRNAQHPPDPEGGPAIGGVDPDRPHHDLLRQCGVRVSSSPKDGLILTNNHVIEGAKQITVKFNDGSQAHGHPRRSVAGQRHRPDQGGPRTTTVPAKLGSSRALAGRRRRRRHRQRAQPRRRTERHAGDHLGQGPVAQHADREPRPPDPDRRRHQPRQLRRAAGQRQGRGRRHQHRDLRERAEHRVLHRHRLGQDVDQGPEERQGRSRTDRGLPRRPDLDVDSPDLDQARQGPVRRHRSTRRVHHRGHPRTRRPKTPGCRRAT